MIIFDIETLADDSHRRHFIENPRKSYPADNLWEPEYESYYAACDKDDPIEQVISIWNDQISLGAMGVNQIWCNIEEIHREKVENWLNKNLLCFESHQLKMRPIGDNTPDDELKERWLDELICSNPVGWGYMRHPIDFVFDSDPKSIEMWRRRGIFVFDCNQSGGEF